MKINTKSDKFAGREAIVDLPIPTTLKELAAYLGEASLINLAIDALVVRVQARCRGALVKDDYRTTDYQKLADAVIENVRKGPRQHIDKVTKAKGLVDTMSAEEKAALLAQLQGSMKPAKK